MIRTAILCSALLLPLTACGPNGPDPADTVRTFMEAAMAEDEVACRACLVKKERENDNFDFNSKTPSGDYTIGSVDYEGDEALVPCTIDGQKITFVLQEEDGEWRLSLMATIQRMFGGMAEQMGQAMAEGMQEGFAQPGK